MATVIAKGKLIGILGAEKKATALRLTPKSDEALRYPPAKTVGRRAALLAKL